MFKGMNYSLCIAVGLILPADGTFKSFTFAIYDYYPTENYSRLVIAFPSSAGNGCAENSRSGFDFRKGDLPFD